MLRITICALLFPVTLLVAQTDNFVYEDYFHRTESVVVDTVTGHFFVEHYDQAAFGNNPFVSGYDAAGELLWEQVFPVSDTAFYFGRRLDGNALINFDADRLLYLGGPGNDCDFPVDNFTLAFLNKADGRIERAYSEQVGYVETDQPRNLNYSLSPNRNRLAIRLENGILLVNNLLTTPLFEIILPNLPITAVTLLNDFTLAYLRPAAVTDVYVQLNLNTGVETSVALPLISNFIEAVSLAGEPYLRSTDSLYLFSLNDVSLTGLFALPAAANLTVATDHFFVVDGPTASYFSYFPTSSSLEPTQTIATAGTKINHLTFANDRYYLSGNHRLSGSNFAYAYWLTGTGLPVAVTSPHDIASDSIVIDSVLLDQFDQPIVAYQMRIRNEGTEPIASFTQDRPTQETFQCGQVPHRLKHFTIAPLLPGEERWILDTTYFDYALIQPGVYRFTFNYTLGRPNEKLDLNETNGTQQIQFTWQFAHPSPSSYASGDFFINHTRATPDLVNGGQFLHGDAIRNGFSDPSYDFTDGAVVALNADGSVRWTWQADNIFWQEGNSVILDAGPDNILVVSGNFVACSTVLLGSERSLFILNRLTGEVETLYGIGQFPEELRFDYQENVLTDPAGENLFIYNYAGNVYRITIGATPGAPELIATPGNFDSPSSLYWLEDRLVLQAGNRLFTYDFTNGSESSLVLDEVPRDVVAHENTLYFLVGEQLARLATNGNFSGIAPVGSTYRFAPSDNGSLLLFDATNNRYFTYQPNSGTVSSVRTLDLPVFSISQLSINQGLLLVAGETGVLNVPDSRRHGFAYHLPLPENDITSFEVGNDAHLVSAQLDSIVRIEDNLPNPPGAYLAIHLTLEIFNTGSSPIRQLTLGVTYDELTFCDFNDTGTTVTLRVDTLDIAPETMGLVHFSYDYYDYGTQLLNGEVEFNELVCVNFPNSQLDANRENNCVNLLLTSTTEEALVADHQPTAFPNPTNGNWFITGIPRGEQRWTLTDLAGKTLQRGINRFEEETPFSVSAHDLPTGVYVLRVGKHNLRLVRQ